VRQKMLAAQGKGAGHEGVRAMVDAEDGWGALLSLFAAKAGGEA